MSARLQGKRALVTAAAQGIGRATALAFAHEGAEVLATDLNMAGLGSLQAEQANIRTAPLDVTDSQAIRAALDQQPFDIVFNCAGWVHHGSIVECDEAAWRRSFDINVDSMYRVCDPGDDEGAGRIHHQHELGGVEYQGSSSALRVWSQ